MRHVRTKPFFRRDETTLDVARPRGAKLRRACHGFKCGIRGRASFSVLFFFAALITATAIALRCELVEWCLLAGCVGAAFAAEFFYSALEALARGGDEHFRQRSVPALDIAASAVLIVRVFASFICAMVVLHHLPLN